MSGFKADLIQIICASVNGLCANPNLKTVKPEVLGRMAAQMAQAAYAELRDSMRAYKQQENGNDARE